MFSTGTVATVKFTSQYLSRYQYFGYITLVPWVCCHELSSLEFNFHYRYSRHSVGLCSQGRVAWIVSRSQTCWVWPRETIGLASRTLRGLEAKGWQRQSSSKSRSRKAAAIPLTTSPIHVLSALFLLTCLLELKFCLPLLSWQIIQCRPSNVAETRWIAYQLLRHSVLEPKMGVLTAHAWYFFSYSLKKQGHTHNLMPVQIDSRTVSDANGCICRTLFELLIANLLVQMQ